MTGLGRSLVHSRGINKLTREPGVKDKMGEFRKTLNMVNLAKEPYRWRNVSWQQEDPLAWGYSPTWHNPAAFYFLFIYLFCLLVFKHKSFPAKLGTFFKVRIRGLSTTLASRAQELPLPCSLWTMSLFFFNFIFLFSKNVYWSIVDLQCCISYCYTAKWISYTYTYIHSFLDSFPI